MKTSLLLLLLVAAVVCAIIAPTKSSPLPGGWAPIPDIDKPEIQELGQWAVAEHVKQAKDGLKFTKVVKGEAQVVAGFNYRLDIHAKNSDGVDGAYRAVVWELPTNGRKLISFTKAN